jgi:glycosyltransferase involved in cell wall biosynthesis
MQELIKIFTKKRFFVRIYETSKNFIFWNDINIYKKIPKEKLIDILKTTSLIEKFANELIISINQQINDKYASNNNKVSVIIPNYNNELFIEKCINSILSNTWENLEVIFIDDASTDNSFEIVKSKFSENPKVRIYQNHTNMGTYYSINRGIILATGHYILNVGSDDFIEPEMIDVCMNCSNWKNWGHGLHFQRLYVKPDNIDKITHINPSNSYVFIFRKELFNRIGYFQNSRFGADSEYLKRAYFYGYNLEFINLPKIYYNAYTIIKKNLTQTITPVTRREYINNCIKILKNKEYIQMSLIENLDEMVKNGIIT